MKNISSDEFKKISFEMLCAFDDVCREHGLHYILDYGTLLGAARHGGYIPWDDDIDVSMPRPDYEKLIRLAQEDETIFKGGDGHFRLADKNNKYNVQKPCLNLIDTRTMTYSMYRKEKYFYPIWMDIFPFDYVPSDPADRKRADAAHDEILKLSFDAQKGCARPMGRFAFLKKFRNAFLEKKVMENLREMDRRTAELAALPHGTLMTRYDSGAHNLIDETELMNPAELPFEGRNFYVPADYEKRLVLLYGDWRQLPPEDQRVPHFTKAWWVE